MSVLSGLDRVAAEDPAAKLQKLTQMRDSGGTPVRWTAFQSGGTVNHPAGHSSLLLNVTGTLVRLYLIRRLGQAFQDPIDDVLGFFVG